MAIEDEREEISADVHFSMKTRTRDEDGSSYGQEKAEPSKPLLKKYGIGARLLSKMGYVEGEGLGANKSGITEPIKSQELPAGMGLGSLSTMKVRDDYESSDEEEHNATVSSVKFKAGEKQPQEAAEKEGYEVLYRLGLSNMATKLADFSTNSDTTFSQKLDTSRTLKELSEVDREVVKATEDLLALEADIKGCEGEESQISRLREVLGKNTPFIDKIADAMAVTDMELSDKLISSILQSEFEKLDDWDPLNPNDSVLNLINSTIDLASYQMVGSDVQLNRTQTVMYQCILSRLRPFLEAFSPSREQISIILAVLLHYEPVLVFTNCMEYILETYIVPKLLKSVEAWHVCEESDTSPRNWFFDFSIFLKRSTCEVFEDQLKASLKDYFQTWYHREDPQDKADLIFIKDALGSASFDAMCREHFLPRFLEQVWDRYFDPILELEEPRCESGLSHFMKVFKSCRLTIPNDCYEILSFAAFNEINQLIFQWYCFSPSNFPQQALAWFKSLVDRFYTEPSDFEAAQIKRSFQFLDNPSYQPIHDESFSVRDAINADKPDPGTFTFKSIPLRNVAVSFRDVVQDFCDEHGYYFRKLSGESAYLPLGSSKSTMVPLFSVRSETAGYEVAIFEDVLWLKETQLNFVPIFLWQLNDMLR